MKNASFIVTLVFAVASGVGIGMVAFNATGPAQPKPAVVAATDGNSAAPTGAPSPSSTAPAPSDADTPPPLPAQEDSFGAAPADTVVAPGAPGSAGSDVLN